MDKQRVELQEYFIILKKDHAEIGLSSRKLKQCHLIENDEFVVITTNAKSVYEEAQNWLHKAYYWREYNAYFSHHSTVQGSWFTVIEKEYIMFYTGSI